MDIEKTMQFILDSQAQHEANMRKLEANLLKSSAEADRRFAQAEARMDRAEARMDRAEARMDRAEKRLGRIEQVVRQNNRLVAALASRGVGLRSDIRRHEKWLSKHELLMTEIGEKLDALIHIVDNMIRSNGRG